jgi:hypothetical protein
MRVKFLNFIIVHKDFYPDFELTAFHTEDVTFYH